MKTTTALSPEGLFWLKGQTRMLKQFTKELKTLLKSPDVSNKKIVNLLDDIQTRAEDVKSSVRTDKCYD